MDYYLIKAILKNNNKPIVSISRISLAVPPKNKAIENKNTTIYYDYFDNIEKATEFLKEWREYK